MSQFFAHVTLLVRDYDEAIAYYTGPLGFTLVEDTRRSESKRWVLVAPPGSPGTCLLLAKAATPEQTSRVGDQTGGRVAFFLCTDRFELDYRRMSGWEFAFWKARAGRLTGPWSFFRTFMATLGPARTSGTDPPFDVKDGTNTGALDGWSWTRKVWGTPVPGLDRLGREFLWFPRLGGLFLPTSLPVAANGDVRAGVPEGQSARLRHCLRRRGCEWFVAFALRAHPAGFGWGA